MMARMKDSVSWAASWALLVLALVVVVEERVALVLVRDCELNFHLDVEADLELLRSTTP